MECPDEVAIFKHLILQDLSSFILFNPRMGSLSLLRKNDSKENKDRKLKGGMALGTSF